MTENNIDSLQRQGRLVKPSRYPSWFPEGAALIRAGFAGVATAMLIALMTYVLVCTFR